MANNLEVNDIVFDDESDCEDYEEYEDCVDADPVKQGVIPYVSVYNTKDDPRLYFIPAEDVTARIVGAERDHETHRHLLNPYIYTIELTHSSFKWQVKRRYHDFDHMHRNLRMYRYSERLKAPVRRYKANRSAKKLERRMTLHHGDGDVSEPNSATRLPAGQPAEGGGVDEIDQPLKLDGEFTSTKVKSLESSVPPADSQDSGTKNGSTGIHVPQEPVLRLSPRDGAAHVSFAVVAEEAVKKKPLKAPRKLPPFPRWPERMFSSDNEILARQTALEKYLNQMLQVSQYRNHNETAKFLEVSRVSFINQLGTKAKEGVVKKRPGGRRTFHGFKRFCIEHCAKWGKRWLVVKDSFVAYLDDDEVIRAVLLYDWDFKVVHGAQQTEGLDHGLLISNLSRNLLLRCNTDDQCGQFETSIRQVTSSQGKVWLNSHRFGSYAPMRQGVYGLWYSDGRGFMDHVANMLEIAKEEIFITDWWLSPEIFMKRPIVGSHWRLDQILKRKAEEGVKIFILLYKEVEMALGINSAYSKRTLTNLHPNVKVMRHPDHIPGSGIFLWAHHEKIIVIDQNISFVGGIDLCYGRWDDHEHKLLDMGSVQCNTEQSVTAPVQAMPHTMFSGMREIAKASTIAPLGSAETLEEASRSTSQTSYKTASTSKLDEPRVIEELPDLDSTVTHETETSKETEEIDVKPNVVVSFSDNNKSTLRSDANDSAPSAFKPVDGAGVSNRWTAAVLKLPQRPVSNPDGTVVNEGDKIKRPFSIGGAGMNDLATLVKQYKDYVDSGQAAKDKERSSTPPPSARRHKENRVKKALSTWKERHKKARETVEEEGNIYEQSWKKLEEEDDQIDSSVGGGGKLWIGKDYVNFIFKDFVDVDMPFCDFIDRHRTPRMPWHDIGSVVYGSCARDVGRHFIERWNSCKNEKFKEDDSYPFLVPKSYRFTSVPRIFRNLAVKVNAQVLRSGTNWSIGMQHTEDSIHMAYIDMISQAEHYIYIENQFFVTQIDSNDVHNRICLALYNRILKAYENNESFRVYVNIPLLPGFEGDVSATQGSALQAVLHWTYQSIARGPHSLVAQLKTKMEDPWKYVSFCSLRTHDVIQSKPITEIIYIHSKLIIVDDKRCLIGSANINDRSQVGKRDSEMAVLYEDVEFEKGRMNGLSSPCGKFCGGLRKHIFKEHLGVLTDKRKEPQIDVTDIASESFFKDVWCAIADNNTLLYENVFRCLPSNLVKSFDELEAYQQQFPIAELNPEMAKETLKQVRGYLVRFPNDFLLNSNMLPSVTTKEGLAPVMLWT